MNIYDEEFFTNVIKISRSLSDVARNLGISTGRGNRQTIKNYIDKYKLSIDHFDYTYDRSNRRVKRNPSKIEDLLSNKVSCNRGSLKKRLYSEGLKNRKCEMCGQSEEWMGKKISLMLDHINGINNDNRLENLRILCPNCNATLDTHCNKNKTKYSLIPKEVLCLDCRIPIDRYSKRCSECDHIRQRKSERPPYDVLIEEVNRFGYCAVGRKYGVSDNSIRKWLKSYIVPNAKE